MTRFYSFRFHRLKQPFKIVCLQIKIIRAFHDEIGLNVNLYTFSASCLSQLHDLGLILPKNKKSIYVLCISKIIYTKKIECIHQNPVRAGFVENDFDWNYGS